MLVRRETPADHAEVRAVQVAAFDRPAYDGRDVMEALLVDELREGGYVIPELTLVVADGSVITGSVVCSWGSLASREVVALGPIGVLPSYQRRGIGRAMVHAVLGAADALDEPVVVLLGDPGYYGQFGFVKSTDVGVLAPRPEWDGGFQVRTLTTWDAALAGDFRYASPFDVT
jgi:putative acetyltransferase